MKSNNRESSARDALNDLKADLSQPSALSVLGLSPELVDKLSADDLLVAANGMFKVLSGIYHPDQRGDASGADDFMAVRDAIKAVRANPTGEKQLDKVMRRQRPKPNKAGQRVTTARVQTSGGDGRWLQSSQDFLVDRYLSGIEDRQSVDHIIRGRFLLDILSYNETTKVPGYGNGCESLSYERDGNISSQRISRLDNYLIGDLNEDDPLKSLFEFTTEDENLLISDGVVMSGDPKTGQMRQLDTDIALPDGWYDIRGMGESRSVTPLEPIGKTKEASGLTILGALSKDEGIALQKYVIANGGRASSKAKSLDEGRSTKATRGSIGLDARGVIPAKVVRRLINGVPNIATLKSTISKGDLLLGYERRSGQGLMLGQVRQQITEFDN